MLQKILFSLFLISLPARADSDFGTLQAQIFVNGQPAPSIPYKLDGESVIAGVTGEDGMIVERNIAQGQWTIMAGCANVVTVVGEVVAQSPTQVDATCNYSLFLPEVSNGKN